MTDDADYTLSDLYDRGIEALASEEPEPGTTYEVAPDLIGRLDPPTPLSVLGSVLAEEVPESCARDVAPLVSFVLDPFLETWDIGKRTPIAKGIAENLEENLRDAIDQSAYERLRQHCSSE